jgi:hypothetical protein
VQATCKMGEPDPGRRSKGRQEPKVERVRGIEKGSMKKKPERTQGRDQRAVGGSTGASRVKSVRASAE